MIPAHIRITIVISAGLLIAGPISAQYCTIPYTDSLFRVQVEPDIWYGNAVRYDGGTDSLRLNLYKPIGDEQTERPLVIVIHGGGFYSGHRNDLNTMAEDLAERGWATATISYRLGFYGSWLFAPPYANDPYEVRRAIYRAMQDAKAAIRFLKGRHLQDSTSTTSVFVLGFSAGAITALHTAYLNAPGERPEDCGAIAPVQHFLNTYPRPDLGPIDGDLNQNGHDASVLGVVNFYGALMDTTYITTPNDPALFSYHQTLDPVVGCGVQQPYWGLGLGIPDNNPWLHGSCVINARVQHLGFTPERYRLILHTGNEHTLHDTPTISAQAVLWMRELFCDLPTTIDPPVALPTTITPNPVTHTATLHLGTTTPVPYQLYDTRGLLLQQGTFRDGRAEIDLSGMATGLYTLHLHTTSGRTTHRMVKE